MKPSKNGKVLCAKKKDGKNIDVLQVRTNSRSFDTYIRMFVTN